MSRKLALKWTLSVTMKSHVCFRLKRYQQPPLPILRISVHEFRRRQRDELLRQPLWRICFERAQGFAVQYNVCSLASYAAGIAAVVACVAVISIRIY